VANLTCVLDASVLHSSALRDLVLSLAAVDLYRPAWSELIHDEWMRSVILRYGNGVAIQAHVTRTRQRMDAAFPDALTDGFQGLISGLTLPDPKDRHVVAAAIQAGATVIVTYNLRDFPSPALAQFGIEAFHPDEFVEYLLQDDIDTALEAIKHLRARLRTPPKSPAEYIDTLINKLLMPRSGQILKMHMARF
jgi:hypothetical protein